MSQGIRTLLLWVVLIVMFAAIYFMFDGASPESRGITRLLGWLLVPLAAVMALIVIFRVREMRRFRVENNAAAVMLAKGELERARGVFQTWVDRGMGPVPASVARRNLGWTLMRMGKLRDALGVLEDSEAQQGQGIRSVDMYATTALDLTLLHALLGDVSAAESWMAKVAGREPAGPQPWYLGVKAFARAVLDCRAGRTEEAARVLDDRWAELEAVLTGEILRPLRVVRAFAHAGAGPRGAGIPEMQLANTRPAYPGEYDFLGVDWPEMATFLAAQRLSGG